MEVGKDSYLSVEHANEIVTNRFMDDEDEYSIWSSLSDNNKAILLVRATTEVDKYNFIGRRLYESKLKFPRYIDGLLITPDEVYIATVLYAIYSYIDKKKDTHGEYESKINSGVKSITVGPNSVVFDKSNITKLSSNIIDSTLHKYILRVLH